MLTTPGDLAQDLITGQVAIAVVDPFEMVDIDHHEGHGLFVSYGLSGRALQRLHQCMAVVDPCQAIMGGQIMLLGNRTLHLHEHEAHGVQQQYRQNHKIGCGLDAVGHLVEAVPVGLQGHEHTAR